MPRTTAAREVFCLTTPPEGPFYSNFYFLTTDYNNTDTCANGLLGRAPRSFTNATPLCTGAKARD
jgi:hypothetical protein